MSIAAQLQCVWCGWEGPLEWPDGEGWAGQRDALLQVWGTLSRELKP